MTNVSATFWVRCEKVFAPVVIIEPWNDLDAVLASANIPDFALHGAVFGRDIDLLQRVISGVDTGGVMVNDNSDFRFDGMPFGGAKRGAIGRESVLFAMEQMSRSKVVCFRVRANDQSCTLICGTRIVLRCLNRHLGGGDDS